MSAPSPEERVEATRLLGGAEEELAVAHLVVDHPESSAPGRAACFHAHLGAEKALKALLVARGIEMLRIHDLVGLADELEPADAARFDIADLEALNPWTIDGRYPEDVADVSPGQVLDLVERAERVVATVRELFAEEE